MQMTNFRKIGEDFFIGPQPTADDLTGAKRQGIRTVIDFRMPAETPTSNASLVKESELNYVNIPVDKTALSEHQIGELGTAIEENDGPFLLHCATGARAAMLLALLRARQDRWTAQRTFDEAKAMGFDLRTSPDFTKFVEKAVDH
jgi:uncharacterized protein (TIGR01244 family)